MQQHGAVMSHLSTTVTFREGTEAVRVPCGAVCGANVHFLAVKLKQLQCCKSFCLSEQSLSEQNTCKEVTVKQHTLPQRHCVVLAYTALPSD
jgi:hypothetical protein